MNATYAAHGIRFSHPADWQRTEEQQDDQINISVATSGTAFWTISLFFGRPDPSDVVESALTAFREEYDQLDVYHTKTRLCQRPTVSCVVDFECLELLNSATLHAFQTRQVTVLVMYQWTNYEAERVEKVFAQMAKSLACLPETGEEAVHGG